MHNKFDLTHTQNGDPPAVSEARPSSGPEQPDQDPGRGSTYILGVQWLEEAGMGIGQIYLSSEHYPTMEDAVHAMALWAEDELEEIVIGDVFTVAPGDDPGRSVVFSDLVMDTRKHPFLEQYLLVVREQIVFRIWIRNLTAVSWPDGSRSKKKRWTTKSIGL